jgi:hypothetical protein
MPEGHQKHRTVPLAPAVALGGLDQLLDFALGEVFAWPMPGRPVRVVLLPYVSAYLGSPLSVYCQEYGQ